MRSFVAEAFCFHSRRLNMEIHKEDSHHSGVMDGLFHLQILDLRKLYPFDSLRSLRVTAVERVFSKKVP